MCEGQHDIEECTTILEQDVEDRSKTIYKKRLCYGCLEGISKEYNAKSVLTEDNAKSVMVDILQYYTGSKLRKINQRKAPTMQLQYLQQLRAKMK